MGFTIFLIQIFSLSEPIGTISKGVVIENFESGAVTLSSYGGQDREPSAWELVTDITHNSTRYALRLYGNTWKLQRIVPCSIRANTVWQIAIHIREKGEKQGVGVVDDSANVLFYTFAGMELPQRSHWITVYQGAFPVQEWHTYSLPIGQDWQSCYEYSPVITGLIYVNDRDTMSSGVVIFDEILDITGDLPICPKVKIQHTVKDKKICNDKFMVGVQFFGIVEDLDSDIHTFYWDFGDDSTSRIQNPYHEFLVMDDHSYTVRLEVVDPDSLHGRDTCKINVDPGTTSYPLTINFVGDVMLARRYEEPGGIIPTYGVEYIFRPTLQVYGNSADISVCNLESPLTDEGTPHPTKSIVFRGSPSNVAGLVYAGIDIVGIGNNHIMDYGAVGMKKTQEVLTANGIRFSGAGMNSYFALQPVFFSKKGVNIAFFSLCNRAGREDSLDMFQPFLDAGYNKPGLGYLTKQNLKRCIEYSRELSDLVVIQMHSGNEYFISPNFSYEGFFPLDPEIIQFPTKPLMRERQLRQYAIDLGADLVICHHPHVLQGFEVYKRKLIAHSLGNFAFDQEFSETFPSVILNSKINANGFYSFSLVPVFIDNYIPKPATGELGLHILNRLANYSRELNTLVQVVPDSVMAYIILDITSVEPKVIEYEDTLILTYRDEYAVSSPLQLSGKGWLSSITSIRGGSSWEVRVGKELLWFGNFESEGATMWRLNSPSELLDSTVAHFGKYSLCLRRYRTSGDDVVTNLEKRLLCNSLKEHSLCGWIKTKNTKGATIQIRYYSSRTSEPHLREQNVGTLVDSTTDWTFYHNELDLPYSAAFYNVRCRNGIPDSAESYAWFDDVKVIEWEDWQGVTTLPLDITWPNEFCFLQIRSPSNIETVFVNYKETTLAKREVQVDQDKGIELPTEFFLFQNVPNPFVEQSIILYWVHAESRVSLKVYNTAGQLVRILVDKVETPGNKKVVWDGKNNYGVKVRSGVYFYRLEATNLKEEKQFTDTKKILFIQR